jgi:hypothetical protein
MVVLDPKGLIAFEERELLYITTLLMLTVVVPVANIGQAIKRHNTILIGIIAGF